MAFSLQYTDCAPFLNLFLGFTKISGVFLFHFNSKPLGIIILDFLKSHQTNRETSLTRAPRPRAPTFARSLLCADGRERVPRTARQRVADAMALVPQGVLSRNPRTSR